MIVICTKEIKLRWEWSHVLHILIGTPIPKVGEKYVIEEYLSFRYITFYKLKGYTGYFESTYFEFIDQKGSLNSPDVRELVMDLVVSKRHLN